MRKTNPFQKGTMQTYIFHIPHTSTVIPDHTNFVVDKVKTELDLLTDHAVDEIFDIDGITKIIFPYSRIFCDVERLDDDKEEMAMFGRGFYYTKTDSGETLRTLDESHKRMVYDRFYQTHHKKLEDAVDKKLKDHGVARIIDCHSFPDEPFKSDLDKMPGRPDICLGTDDYHTPANWLAEIKNTFTEKGYSVKINIPYSGTIVPLKHYKKNKQVHSIMIEVNRRLYMENGKVINESVGKLNEVMKALPLG